jgi:hypothetical protein
VCWGREYPLRVYLAKLKSQHYFGGIFSYWSLATLSPGRSARATETNWNN